MGKQKKRGNIANLKMWKPGQSGNPNGRPKTLPNFQKLLAEVLGGYADADKKTKMQEIVEALAADSTDKNSKTKARSAEILIERAYGKVKEGDKAPEDQPQKITGFKIKKK